VQLVPPARGWWTLPTVAFALTRLWLIAIPFGYISYLGGTLVINDVTLYENWADILQEGRFPVGDPMWQYPPLVGPLLAAGALIPPDPTLGLVLLMLAFDATIFFVLMRSAKAGSSVEGVWAWIAAGMLIGPVWLTRFDVVPALFAVLALLWINRPVRSAAMMALGALFKVWPVLLLISVPRHKLAKAVASFAATAAAALGVLILTFDGAGAFASEQRARGLQIESMAALPFMIGHHFGWDRTFIYRYGAMEVEAQGTQMVALIVTIAALVALGSIAVLRLTGRLDHAAPADIALVVVLVSMITSRVLSPQYLVWVAAISAVCLLDRRTAMRPVIVMLMPVALLGQVLYPMHYNWLMSDTEVRGLILQSARIALLVAATGWGTWRLLRRPSATADVRVDAVEQIGQPA
jgi:Glycosyltransferase family 87